MEDLENLLSIGLLNALKKIEEMEEVIILFPSNDCESEIITIDDKNPS